MSGGRVVSVTPASLIEPKPDPSIEAADVVEAARRALPDEWQILPDGRSAPKLIALFALMLADEREAGR